MSIPTIDMIRTGQNIRDLRIRSGMSVAALQNIFGFATPQAIFKWQRGDSIPSVDNLVILAKVFGCKVDDILIVS